MKMLWEKTVKVIKDHPSNYLGKNTDTLEEIRENSGHSQSTERR